MQRQRSSLTSADMDPSRSSDAALPASQAGSSTRPMIRHSASVGPGATAPTSPRMQNIGSPSTFGLSPTMHSPINAPPPSSFVAPSMNKPSLSNLSVNSRSSFASSSSNFHGPTSPLASSDGHMSNSVSSPAVSTGSGSALLTSPPVSGRAPSVRSFGSDRSGNSKISRTSRATTATTRGNRKSNRNRILASAHSGLYGGSGIELPVEEEVGMTALQRAQSSMGRHSIRSSVSSTTTSASGRATSIGYASATSPLSSPPVPGLPGQYQNMGAHPHSDAGNLPPMAPLSVSSNYASSIVSSSASSVSGRSRRRGSHSPSRHAHKLGKSAITRQAESALSVGSYQPLTSSASTSSIYARSGSSQGRVSGTPPTFPPGSGLGSGLGPSIVLDTEHLERRRKSVDRGRTRQLARSDSLVSEGWQDADSDDQMGPAPQLSLGLRPSNSSTRVHGISRTTSVPTSIGETNGLGVSVPTGLSPTAGGFAAARGAHLTKSGADARRLGKGSSSAISSSSALPSPALSAPSDMLRMNSNSSSNSGLLSPSTSSAAGGHVGASGFSSVQSQLSPSILSNSSSFNLVPATPSSGASSTDGLQTGFDSRGQLTPASIGDETRFFTPPEDRSGFFSSDGRQRKDSRPSALQGMGSSQDSGRPSGSAGTADSMDIRTDSSSAAPRKGHSASGSSGGASSTTGARTDRDAQREGLSSGSSAFLPLPTVMERSGSADTRASRDSHHHASSAAAAISGLRSRLLSGFKSSSRKKSSGSLSGGHGAGGGLTSGEVTETENNSANSSNAVTPMHSAHPSPRKASEPLPMVAGFTPLDSANTGAKPELFSSSLPSRVGGSAPPSANISSPHTSSSRTSFSSLMGGKSRQTSETGHRSDVDALPVLPEISRTDDSSLMPSFLKRQSTQSPPTSSAGQQSADMKQMRDSGNASHSTNGSFLLSDHLSPKTLPPPSPELDASDLVFPAVPVSQPAGGKSGTVAASNSAPSPKSASLTVRTGTELSPPSGAASTVRLSPVSSPSASTPTSSRSPTLRAGSLNKNRPAQLPAPTHPLPPPPVPGLPSPTSPGRVPSSLVTTAAIAATSSPIAVPASPAGLNGIPASSGTPPVIPPRMRPVRNPLRSSIGLVPGQSGVPPLPNVASTSAVPRGTVQDALQKLDPTGYGAGQKVTSEPSVKELPPPPPAVDLLNVDLPKASAILSGSRTSSTPNSKRAGRPPTSAAMVSDLSRESTDTDDSLVEVAYPETDSGKVTAVTSREPSVYLRGVEDQEHRQQKGAQDRQVWTSPDDELLAARAVAPTSASAWMTGEGVLGEHLLEGALSAGGKPRPSLSGDQVGDISLASSSTGHSSAQHGQQRQLGSSAKANASTASLGTMKRGRLGLGGAFRSKKEKDEERARGTDLEDDPIGSFGEDGEGQSPMNTLSKRKGRKWPFGKEASSGLPGSGAASDAEEGDFLGRTRRKSKGEGSTSSRVNIRRLMSEEGAPVPPTGNAVSQRGSIEGDRVEALPSVGNLSQRSGTGLSGRHNSISGSQNNPPQTLRGHRPSLPSLRRQPSQDNYASQHGHNLHSPSSYTHIRRISASGIDSEDGKSQRWPSTSQASAQDHGSASDHGFSVGGSLSMHTTMQGLQPNASAETKRLYKRANVIRELIETERRYAADLRVIRDVYLIPARMAAGLPSTPVTPLSALSMTSGFMGPGGSSILTPSSLQSLQRGGSTTSLPMSSSLQVSRKPSLDAAGFHPSLGVRASSGNMSAQAGLGVGLPVSTDAQAAPLPSPGPSASVATTSQDTSNRSSLYTVSSQSSVTTQSTAPPVPPMPHNAPSGSSTPGGEEASRLSSQQAGSKASVPPPLTLGSIPPPLSHPNSAPLTSQVGATHTPPIVQGLTPSPSTISSAGLHALGGLDGPLSAVEIRVLFTNLEQCCAFAEEMVAHFDAAAEERAAAAVGAAGDVSPASPAPALAADVGADTVGRVFLKMMPRMEQVYAFYCAKHEASMTRLADITRSNSKGAAFIRDCTEVARSQTNAWDLASLLIKPVQRVLKYPLLLRQILDATSTSQPEYGLVREALGEMIRIADHLNEVKKRRDLIDGILGNSFGPGKVGSRSASISNASSNTISRKARKKIEKEKDKASRSAGGGVGASLLVPVPEDTYRSLVSELNKLETAIHDFPSRCLIWCDALKATYEAEARLLAQWRTVYACQTSSNSTELPSDFNPSSAMDSALDPETEERLATLVAVSIDALSPSGSCQRVVDTVRGSIIPQTGRLLHFLLGPRQVMAKRDGLQPEYARYKLKVRLAIDGTSLGSLSSPGVFADPALAPSPVTLAATAKVNKDTVLVEAAEAFVALHTQLLEELPILIYGLQVSLDALVRAFATLQERVYEERQAALLQYGKRLGWFGSEDDGTQGPRKTAVASGSAGAEVSIVKAYWSKQRQNEGVLMVLEGRRPDCSATGDAPDV
ncbi:hypothetical protein OC845_006149 [Tilletia horrida]|nr:hypothetical protein OC845_006149 [Tilletia horrida]